MTVGLLLVGALLLGRARAQQAPPVEPGPPVVQPVLGEGSQPPPVAPLAPFQPPVAEVQHLPSGIPVWFISQPGLPLVRITVSLRRGVLQADPALPLVHAGALLDEPPRGWQPRAWQAALDEVGAELSLGVGMARAWASVELPAGHEARGLELLVAALSDPALPRRAFRDNRAAAARDAARAWAVPGTLHAMAVQRALYPADHPLGRIWTAGEQRAVSRRQARRAWAEELALAAPSVVVVGAVDAERILPLLEQSLGELPAAGEDPAELPQLAPPPPGPRTLLVDLPGLERVFVSLLVPTPGAFGPEEAPLELLHRALSAEFDSRLSRLLRVDRGWTYGVHGLLRVWPGHGVMEIRFAVAPEVLAEAIPAVEAELEAMGQRPPEGQELSRAVAAVRRDAALRQLRLSRLAGQLAVEQAWGQGPGHERAFLAAVEAVEAEQLAVLARELFRPDRAIWVLTGDRDQVEPVLDDAGLRLDSIRGAAAIVDGGPPLPL